MTKRKTYWEKRGGAAGMTQVITIPGADIRGAHYYGEVALQMTPEFAAHLVETGQVRIRKDGEWPKGVDGDK